MGQEVLTVYQWLRGIEVVRSAPAAYPGPLGWANQLAQILVQEVRHACSACSVSVMHDGTEHGTEH